MNFPTTHKEWLVEIERIGGKWRKRFRRGVPAEIAAWWAEVTSYESQPLHNLPRNKKLCSAIIQLCAAADEACAGVGIPGPKLDAFYQRVGELLVYRETGSTLCRDIHWSKARVLPKQHAPRSGITIRSMSHHLALCPSLDVVPHWVPAPNPNDNHYLRVVLVPWPKRVVPAQFRAASPAHGQLENMNREHFGMFCVDPSAQVQSDEDNLCDHVLAIIGEAEKIAGKIDGVILPELAVIPEQHSLLREKLVARGYFLICGVSDKSRDPAKPGENYVLIDIPLSSEGDKPFFTEIRQSKHHRWRLDRNQIVQYGLGAQLDPTKVWWEYISLESRELSFITLQSWLTMCVLICEDLARPDPVGDIVRSVGPNLVIALLMDGPQLNARWPGRYATVLADDPGSSVLTLSSAGMVDLSRPSAGVQRSRVVALWKDGQNRETTQIDFPQGADAIVISLTCDKEEEFTADGRSDHKETAYPALTGIQSIFLQSSPAKKI